MGRAKEALKKDLLDLEPADRAEVAEDALRSLDATAYGELSPAWEDEIERRVRAVDDGTTELIPSEDVYESQRFVGEPMIGRVSPRRRPGCIY
jgi:putative addiction module component (TIGR02574 family)